MESKLNKFNLVLVSYLNTYPIVWGLRRLERRYQPMAKLCPPSQCTRALIEGFADLALVPSITLLKYPQSFEVLPLGIVAEREVDTVLLVGNSPLEAWKIVLLDNDSLTSVQLTKILFRLKNLTPVFIRGLGGIESLDHETGALMIGNKCFHLASRFTYRYDLSRMWFDLTGLPFVFALFLFKPTSDRETLVNAYEMISEAITCGLANLDQVIDDWMKEDHSNEVIRDRAYYHDYLTNKISYPLTLRAIQGLKKFYDYCEEALPPEKAGRLTRDYFHHFDRLLT
ncbi:MAG: menaquinone biosynthesis protein [Deltaproteobacteria bacterium]|nr:menaquinone biosynthesis protein [Deltaproteobacteria bacterium]